MVSDTEVHSYMYFIWRKFSTTKKLEKLEVSFFFPEYAYSPGLHVCVCYLDHLHLSDLIWWNGKGINQGENRVKDTKSHSPLHAISSFLAESWLCSNVWSSCGFRDRDHTGAKAKLDPSVLNEGVSIAGQSLSQASTYALTVGNVELEFTGRIWRRLSLTEKGMQNSIFGSAKWNYNVKILVQKEDKRKNKNTSFFFSTIFPFQPGSYLLCRCGTPSILEPYSITQNAEYTLLWPWPFMYLHPDPLWRHNVAVAVQKLGEQSRTSTSKEIRQNCAWVEAPSPWHVFHPSYFTYKTQMSRCWPQSINA